MDVLLIKDGRVENCISADSVDRALTFHPDYICMARVGNEGPGYTYDGTTFTPPPPPVIVPDLRITQLAFMTRFTDSEAIAIDMASQGTSIQAAYMRRYQSKLNAATWIDLANTDTQAGVHQLEAAGLLGAGRAVTILTAPVQATERPVGAPNVA